MVKRSQNVEYEKSYERKTTLAITFDATCSKEANYEEKPLTSNFYLQATCASRIINNASGKSSKMMKRLVFPKIYLFIQRLAIDPDHCAPPCKKQHFRADSIQYVGSKIVRRGRGYFEKLLIMKKTLY